MPIPDISKSNKAVRAKVINSYRKTPFDGSDKWSQEDVYQKVSCSVQLSVGIIAENNGQAASDLSV